MNVLAAPRIPRRTAPTKVVPVPVAAPVTVPQAGYSRWWKLLGIPFVLGASFFGLAVGLGAEWPMIPAFMLGPFLFAACLLVLMLSSDSNTE
jgi:hypothetical protein